MQTINLASLLAFIVVAFLGAIVHRAKKKRCGEMQGKRYGYPVAHEPGSAAMTSTLNGFDLAVASAYLKAGNLPMLHVLVSALGVGWMADSGLTKGQSHEAGQRVDPRPPALVEGLRLCIHLPSCGDVAAGG